MALKPVAVRKALLGLVVLALGLTFYLYWVQVDRRGIRVTRRYERRFGESWTWKCIENRCERRHTINEEEIPLETCNMLCGSTQLWPQPTGPIQLGSKYEEFYPNQISFELNQNYLNSALLLGAKEIFMENINSLITSEKDITFDGSTIGQLTIRVIITNNNHTTLKLNTNEGYNITVKLVGRDLLAVIKAKNFFGARHGLETLSQLIWAHETYHGTILRILRGASIQDSPKFAYRGLMLDTSRHFFSTSHLKKLLIGMAANKLNIFHWHLTDSQSFPFDSPRVPKMAEFGALSPDMIYSVDDIRSIVQFAKVRGIRVLIELDTPAHSGNGWNWGVKSGLGQLAVCVNQQPWYDYCGEPPCGQLNPDNPNIYKVLQDLYTDILDSTEEREMFHLGGDEVNLHCWELQQMVRPSPNNYTDLHDVWGEFTLKAMNILKVANEGRVIPNIIMWSSDLTKRPYIEKYLNKHRVIVQVWGGSTWPETTDLLDYDYRIIISHVDAWYLDCGFGKWREVGSAACDPYRTWQTVYTHRPWQRLRLPPTKHSLVLGGEACLWTEQVEETSLDTRLWPRAAALAERLWSDPSQDLDGLTVHEDVYTRLVTQRNRMVKRGLNAEAMWPEWCSQNPGMCL